MPLPENQTTIQTATNLTKTLRGAFGTPSAYRPAHARGRLVRGTFTPTPLAGTLSKAPHFTSPSTPLTVRFSSSTGLPSIPDSDGNANPRGMAIRFLLPNSNGAVDGHKHTDIIAHSTPFFPMRTGESFLAMLKAVGDGSIGEFLEREPTAKAFVQGPKPSPESFVRERYFSVNAFKFVSPQGGQRFVRYRITPDAGVAHISDAEVKEKGPDYLFDELAERMASGKGASFTLYAQIAEEGYSTDDATKHWPESREVVALGEIKLESLVEEGKSKREQQHIIFDPIPRVEGVEATEDPLLDMRAAVYLVSERERRAAKASA